MRLEISTWNRVYRWLQTRAVALACFSVVLFALTSLLNMEARASGPHELNIQGASAFGRDAQLRCGKMAG